MNLPHSSMEALLKFSTIQQSVQDLFVHLQLVTPVCCVFRPAFKCWAHPKAVPNNFFSRFQPFLFILNLFQYIFKKVIFTNSNGCLDGSEIPWKRFKMNKKSWKQLKKVTQHKLMRIDYSNQVMCKWEIHQIGVH